MKGAAVASTLILVLGALSILVPVVNVPLKLAVTYPTTVTTTSLSATIAVITTSVSINMGPQPPNQLRFVGNTTSWDFDMTFQCSRNKVIITALKNGTFAIENPTEFDVRDVQVQIQLTSTGRLAGKSDYAFNYVVDLIKSKETKVAHTLTYVLDAPLEFPATPFLSSCLPNLKDTRLRVVILSYVGPAELTQEHLYLMTQTLTRTVDTTGLVPLSRIIGVIWTTTVLVAVIALAIGIYLIGGRRKAIRPLSKTEKTRFIWRNSIG